MNNQALDVGEATSAAVEARRRRVAEAWKPAEEVVLIGAGEPLPIPGGADQVYPFLSHSEYFYLTDHECAGAVLAFDPATGWTDFVPEVTEAERVWEGRTAVEGEPLTGLAGWLAARRGRPLAMLGSPLAGVKPDPVRSEELRLALTHARRPKDELEIDRMRRAAAATAAGFAVAREMIRPGVAERQIQIELEAEFRRHGGDRTGFGTIVGTGSNSGVLHFTPTARALRAGDSVLIDAGAEVERYAGDVTRTYSVGAATPFFRDLYQVVLAVEERAISRCVANAEFRDLHLAACRELAAGLVSLGILRGSPESLVDQDAHALFFPHGLGHMVGLGVRDASGYLPGRQRSHRPGLKNLRTDLPLLPGYGMTIEPGIYFIPALLNDAQRRERYREAVNWSRVDELLDFGGIRIEDDVLVTAGAPEVLTAAIPKAL
jgi:Xaa-Pro aminopeptidase